MLAGCIPGPASEGPVPAAELVRAAVCSMGPEDRAKRQCCGPERSLWAAGHSPTRGHCGPLSLCGHIVGQDAGCARDRTDGQILGQLRPLAEQEEEGEEGEGAGAAPSTGPAFPGMGSEELRLASFHDWPLTTVVRPELLAAAGFFHTGEPGGPAAGGAVPSLGVSPGCFSLWQVQGWGRRDRRRVGLLCGP